MKPLKYTEQDETACVQNLLRTLDFPPAKAQKASALAADFVKTIRQKLHDSSGVEALITHYDLSTAEGVTLMTIAEALLRIPDSATRDLLIRDKLANADWQAHVGKSRSFFVNLVTRGLALTSQVLTGKNGWREALRRYGSPSIRKAVRRAVKVMGNQFVVGRDIEEALKVSQSALKKGYLFSYDMLGEVARTQADADRYFQAYQQAIAALRNNAHFSSISIKLSALYPRYTFSHRELAIPALTQKLHILAQQARQAGIGLTVDAEEADRLNMSLDIFTAVFTHPDFRGWNGLGLAVQAYQKRALPLIHWLIDLARSQEKRINVRLVKGAYWDSEIKFAQIGGYKDYPVFTRKSSTDLSYLACAQHMLAAQDAIYPQFATHNAYSVAAILTMMDDGRGYDFEFQCLQGMGRALHDQIVERGIASRIYAPVGSHEDLLPYLVRRLLENGANSSFVNQLANPRVPIENLIISPMERIRSYELIANPKIPLPENIFGPNRLNSAGLDLTDEKELQNLLDSMAPFQDYLWQATPLGRPMESAHAQLVLNPANQRQVVGHVLSASKADVEQALINAVEAFPTWNQQTVEHRADLLLKFAQLLEKHRAELICLAAREAGKTLAAGISEVREAVDFCRYYSQIALKTLAARSMPGPTGESNTLRLTGRGPLLSISPWNFPIAIFTGQVVAALITGNAVIAKPAEQTPLTAARIVQLLHEAGVPEAVIQLLPGTGETVGAALTADPRIQAVLFTGSTETAKIINKTLAQRSGPIVPLIAETGGVNAMIADSSALPEQIVNDAITSAFDSAGQRCSALRILFVQEEIADKVLAMLRGAMAELIIGNPLDLKTDVGPVIDMDAKKMLMAHSEKMASQAKLIYQVELPKAAEEGVFVAPQAYELADFRQLQREVFGPILHVVRYSQDQLPQVVRAINDTGYGLTFGIQSRVDSTIDYLQRHVQAGNIYVNRNMIGAVVGVQPFGGNRLSGTGPKAGGPHYLIRLCNENTLTINTTATGGNPGLMALDNEGI
jgi:RHH-type transcriptional regulator, proline utilization regulon repressor / proline dehydrogenase / delta 1-pyrroline-5-carboxylate dehydrogenase